MIIPRIFFAQASKLGNKTSLIYKQNDGTAWQEISWLEFSRRVRAVAIYLVSTGVKKGDKVLLLSENRPEWPISDLAILSIGGITVPAYFTSTPSQIDYIVRDSDAKIALVSTMEQLKKITSGESGGRIEKILLFDEADTALPDGTIPISAIIEQYSGQGTDRIDAAMDATTKDDIASILYTSGTTGPPKGVMLTHGNFLSNVLACADVVNIGREDTLLSFLPLSHAFERTAGYYVPLVQGAAIAYAESIDKLPQNMLEVKPTVMLGVPRFYEKIYARILETAGKGPSLKRILFGWGVETGMTCSARRRDKRRIPPMLALKRTIADRIIFRKIRSGFGGRLRFFVSGGAPLSRQIADFFDALGVIILEGYGLTETSPVITCNTESHRKRGSVGRPLPGVEVRISEDGEILTRGPHVMKGYYKKDELTSEAIKGGWFYTGDIGILDNEGYLTITDRKKDIIITSGGKNVAPQNIETALVADPLISQVMIYGENKKFLTALIVPDMEKLVETAGSIGIKNASIETLIGKEEIRNLYSERVGEMLKDFAPFEKIKKFVLLPEEFSMGKGEITPTLKVNRKVVTERYKGLLEELYEE